MNHSILKRLYGEKLLLLLSGALLIIGVMLPKELKHAPEFIDWPTLASLCGLLILSRGLEDSNYPQKLGARLIQLSRSGRRLAFLLIIISAVLASFLTNDIALFIVIPLTLNFNDNPSVPVGRLIIFEALAVNAGASISPIGNPQNLFLWKSAHVGFASFVWGMLPISLFLFVMVALLALIAFPNTPLTSSTTAKVESTNQKLLWTSLILYPVFFILVEFGQEMMGAFAIILLYAVAFRNVLRRVDWILLLIFALMFIDLRVLANLPQLQHLGLWLQVHPHQVFNLGVGFSQILSNVPSAIFLRQFTSNWRALAWGVDVGGFGIAIGSLANIIALRLSNKKNLWREFHFWSIIALILAILGGMFLLRLPLP